jgi:hypothetical protein
MSVSQATALHEVFSVGSVVRPLSYVDRGGLDERLIYALDAGRHVIIHGDSKQGKSWLRAKVVGSEKAVVVQCQQATTTESLLTEALGALGVRAELKLTKGANTEGTLDFATSASLGIKVLAKLGVSGGYKKVSGSSDQVETEAVGQTPADLAWVGRTIEASGKRLVVEDFHYVVEEERTRFAFVLKALGEYGVCPIIVGVWPQDHLLTYYNGDLEGRVEDIHLTWTTEELSEVLEQGSAALNITMSASLRTELIEDAHGNVGLLQRLAEQLCKEEGIYETQNHETLLTPGPSLERARAAIAEAMRSRFEGFADNFVKGYRHLRGPGKPAYYHLLRAIADTPDSELLTGVEPRELLAEIGSGAHLRDVRAALRRIDKFQAGLGISPIVLTYSNHAQRVSLVDRSFLFFRRYGDPRWPWSEDGEV